MNYRLVRMVTIIAMVSIEYEIKDERHANLQRMEMTKRTAKLMPDPSPAMIEVIGHLIENVYQVSCLQQKDLDVRAAAVHAITQLIESNFPGLRVRTYGSYITGINPLRIFLRFQKKKEKKTVDQFQGILFLFVRKIS